eukprot:TRINITY_DN7472_c0_g1_i1.p1 TRINITY_DN7472_c0_g1~~TRINITY_DN7472_c0_g1_i1.p1  ORF type:complete len:258 (+),score=33.85 TRINITY_DN7472_c0_g1_i1:96-869(+)
MDNHTKEEEVSNFDDTFRALSNEIKKIQEHDKQVKALTDACEKMNYLLSTMGVTNRKLAVSDTDRSADDIIEELFRPLRQYKSLKPEFKKMLVNAKTEYEPQVQNKHITLIRTRINHPPNPLPTQRPTEFVNDMPQTESSTNKEFFVEFAIFKNIVNYLDVNIKKVLTSVISTRKEVTVNGKLQYEKFGYGELRPPIRWELDEEDTIREYADDNQVSGILVFDKEYDAKVWRCLTFPENYQFRPNGVFIPKKQRLFT